MIPGQILEPQSNYVYYDHYSAGRNNDISDMMQPYYLSNDFEFKFTSPIFDVKINGTPISLHDVEMSYIYMLQDWLAGEKLWGIQDAIKFQEMVDANNAM